MFENETFRKFLFGVVAVGLVALAVYATVFTGNEEKAPKDEPTPAATIAPTAAPTVDTPGDEPLAKPKVDQPLSNAELNAAASVAQDFLITYGSFDYRKKETDQLVALKQYVDSDAQFDVSTVVPRGADREAKVAKKVITTATVRFKGSTFTTTDSASFLVVLTTDSGDGPTSDELTITMVGGGDRWLVNALDQGDEFGEA